MLRLVGQYDFRNTPTCLYTKMVCLPYGFIVRDPLSKGQLPVDDSLSPTCKCSQRTLRFGLGDLSLEVRGNVGCCSVPFVSSTHCLHMGD